VKKLIKILYIRRLERFLLFFSLVLFLFIGTTCNNGLDNPGSDNNPIGAGIIDVVANPAILFGNGAKPDGTGHAQIDAEIQATTNQFPDGSTIQFALTGSDLPSFLRGCLINPSTVLTNGQAFVDYVTGIFIPKSTSCSGTNPPTAHVNVSITVTTPQGIKQSDFGQITLQCIGIIPPADQQITTNPPTDNMNFVFLTLEFQTIGIPPGTTVNFSLSRPDLGSLNPTSAPVGGSEAAGTVSTQYTAQNKGGAQVITAAITLPNPSDVDPRCPSVPIEDRQIRAVVTITQSTPQPTPAPSPSP
jgi:hypothetical protein